MMFKREWAMPNADTFDVPVIGAFVRRYLHESKLSIDPFARNKRWAQFTNDLNPQTRADFHMDAADFLDKLINDGVRADLVIVDPPYSPRQVKECYDGIGQKMEQTDALLGLIRGRLKSRIRQILTPGGTVLTFGWNSVGMGKGFEIAEILMVCHGSDHNDTICLAEKRTQEIFDFKAGE